MYEKKELNEALKTIEALENFVSLCGTHSAKGSCEWQVLAHVWSAVKTCRQTVSAELVRAQEAEQE